MNTLNADYLHILEQAGKAPSGHNTQPWRFAVSNGQITLRPDFRATLPVVDPDNRELYISLGCALENLCLAAGTRGYRTRITQTDQHGITIVLEAATDAVQNPLTGAITQRRTNRATYDGRRIPEDTLRTIPARLHLAPHRAQHAQSPKTKPHRHAQHRLLLASRPPHQPRQ